MANLRKFRSRTQSPSSFRMVQRRENILPRPNLYSRVQQLHDILLSLDLLFDTLHDLLCFMAPQAVDLPGEGGDNCNQIIN